MALTPVEQQQLASLKQQRNMLMSQRGAAGVDFNAPPVSPDYAPEENQIQRTMRMGEEWLNSGDDKKARLLKLAPEKAAQYERAAAFGTDMMRRTPQLLSRYSGYGVIPEVTEAYNKAVGQPYTAKERVAMAPMAAPDVLAALGGLAGGLGTKTPQGAIVGAATGGAYGKLAQNELMSPEDFPKTPEFTADVALGVRKPSDDPRGQGPMSVGESVASVAGEAALQGGLEATGIYGGKALVARKAKKAAMSADWALPVAGQAEKTAQTMGVESLMPSQRSGDKLTQLLRTLSDKAFVGGGGISNKTLRQNKQLTTGLKTWMADQATGISRMTDADFGRYMDDVVKGNRSMAKEATEPAFAELRDALSPTMVQKEVPVPVLGAGGQPMLDAAGQPLTKMAIQEVPEGGFRMNVADLKKQAQATIDRMGTPKAGTPQKALLDDLTYIATQPDELTYDEAKTVVQSFQHLTRQATKKGAINVQTGTARHVGQQLVDRFEEGIRAISPELADKHAALMETYSAIKREVDNELITRMAKEAGARGRPEYIVDYIMQNDTPTRMKVIKKALTYGGDETPWNAVRGKYLERLADESINPDTLLVDPARLSARLDRMGPEALEVLLGGRNKADALKEIAQLSRVINGAAERDVVGAVIIGASQVGSAYNIARDPGDPDKWALGGVAIAAPALISLMFTNPRLANMYMKIAGVPTARATAPGLVRKFLGEVAKTPAAKQLLTPQNVVRGMRAADAATPKTEEE